MICVALRIMVGCHRAEKEGSGRGFAGTQRGLGARPEVDPGRAKQISSQGGAGPLEQEGQLMAVYKRGKTYWYEFQFKGQRVQESAQTGNKDVARQIEAAHR